MAGTTDGCDGTGRYLPADSAVVRDGDGDSEIDSDGDGDSEIDSDDDGDLPNRNRRHHLP